MFLTILFIVLYAIFLAFGGVMNAHRAWAKSSNDRFIPDEFAMYKFYFQSGNGQDGWRFKWKNGRKEDGEAFWQSSRTFVGTTDWYHFSEEVYNLFLSLAIACLPVIAVSTLYFDGRIWVALSISTACAFSYRFFNAVGFVAMEKQNKIAVKFARFWQRLGLIFFIKLQYKYNRAFFEKMLNN